jgi:hypothetical protein
MTTNKMYQQPNHFQIFIYKILILILAWILFLLSMQNTNSFHPHLQSPHHILSHPQLQQLQRPQLQQRQRPQLQQRHKQQHNQHHNQITIQTYFRHRVLVSQKLYKNNYTYQRLRVLIYQSDDKTNKIFGSPGHYYAVRDHKS